MSTSPIQAVANKRLLSSTPGTRLAWIALDEAKLKEIEADKVYIDNVHALLNSDAAKVDTIIVFGSSCYVKPAFAPAPVSIYGLLATEDLLWSGPVGTVPEGARLKVRHEFRYQSIISALEDVGYHVHYL